MLYWAYNRTMNKEDLIYVSGFIDGEGCITSCNNHAFRITISSTDKIILDWLLVTFGGCVNDLHLPINPNHNIAWKWIISKREDLKQFLFLIYPYLKIKQSQVKVVIDFYNKYPNSAHYKNNLGQRTKDYLIAKDLLRKLKTDRHFKCD